MHINLTKTDCIDPETVARIHKLIHFGGPCVEVVLKRNDLSPFCFHGEDGVEAWNNWQAYIRGAEERRCGG